MSNPFQERFSSIEEKLQRTLAQLPAKAGTMAVNYFKESFRNQGFTDETLDPWTARKSEDEKNPSGRAILVKTGRLRRSIRLISTTANSATVGTDVPYARIHNEGGTALHHARGMILNFDHAPTNGRWRFGKAGTISQQRGIKAIRRATFKEYTTTMPQRKFMGNSRNLKDNITFMMAKDLTKAFKLS